MCTWVQCPWRPEEGAGSPCSWPHRHFRTVWHGWLELNSSPLCKNSKRPWPPSHLCSPTKSIFTLRTHWVFKNAAKTNEDWKTKATNFLEQMCLCCGVVFPHCLLADSRSYIKGFCTLGFFFSSSVRDTDLVSPIPMCRFSFPRAVLWFLVDIRMQKNEGWYFSHIIKVNSKWIICLNLGAKISHRRKQT